jgi:hypothetical protein
VPRQKLALTYASGPWNVWLKLAVVVVRVAVRSMKRLR